MIETDALILDKAKFSDWYELYHTVWSRPESAKYMAWNITTSEDDAKRRIMKTIEYQKNHDTYVVYEKESGKPIGFAGIEKNAPYVYQETGICLGPDYTGKGFGKQIVLALIQYCQQKYNAKEFLYSTREENIISNKLAHSLGFVLIASQSKIDKRDGHNYILLTYSLNLSEK